MRFLLHALLVVAVPTASCQGTPAEVSDPQDHTTVLDTNATVPAQADGLTAAERAVQEIVSNEGVHVVRFWAPWCHNSMNELRSGLYEMIEEHPDVTFTFVTVRNDGEDGQPMLARFGIPDRVTVLAEEERAPLTFLGLPITWTPTTWIFNREGKLAYAFNYGEVTPALLAQAIADAHSDWHD